MISRTRDTLSWLLLKRDWDVLPVRRGLSQPQLVTWSSRGDNRRLPNGASTIGDAKALMTFKAVDMPGKRSWNIHWGE